MPDQPGIQPTQPIQAQAAPIQPIEAPAPKNLKDFISGILWEDISAELGGGRKFKAKTFSIILIIVTLVLSLIVLEFTGVIDDFVAMRKSKEIRGQMR